MPVSASKPCGHPGCGALVNGTRYCPKHQQDNHQYDQRRGSSAQRGYGYRWQKASKAFLARNPLCRYCLREERITASTIVDHIVPHRGDPVLFWDESNWQALCSTCHNSIKQSEEKNPLSLPR